MPESIDWERADNFVADPMSWTLADLKTLALQLDVKRSGSKDELVLRLLQKFGINHPTDTPAKVLFASASGKSEAHGTGSGGVRLIDLSTEAKQHRPNVAAMQKTSKTSPAQPGPDERKELAYQAAMRRVRP